MPDARLGDLAVAHRFLSPEALRHCLEIQSKTQPPKLLGEILLDEGYLCASDIQSLLAIKQRSEDKVSRQTHRALAGVPAELGALLAAARRLGATHVGLSAQAQPYVRRLGRVVPLELPRLTAADVEKILTPIVDAQILESLDREKGRRWPCELPEMGRFIAHIFRHRAGLGAVMKLVPEEIPPAEFLALPAMVEKTATLRQGLVLIVGPSGSGKTTTLASLVERIKHGQSKRVITLEDPIEYRFKSGKSLISQRQIGRDVLGFSEALRETLRSNPDVIVVSELCTPTQIACALTAAETGHLVYATMPTAGVLATLETILDSQAGQRQAEIRSALAATLRLITSQELLPDKDGSRMRLASEVLVVNTAVRHALREGRLQQIPMLIQTGHANGMASLDDSLASLVKEGHVTEAEALSRAVDVQQLMRHFRREKA